MSEGISIPLQDEIRVLFINPDEASLKHYKKQLELVDPLIVVDPVLTSDEARRRFQEGWYECVISDHELPGMDGISLAAEFKRKRNIVFILLTSTVRGKLMVDAHNSGIDDVIIKKEDPQQVQILAKTIRKHVEKCHSEVLCKELMNQNLDAIVILDGTKIVYSNKRASNFMGLEDPRQLYGYDILDILVNEDKNEIIELLDDVSKGRYPSSKFDASVKTTQGELREIEIYITRIKYRGKDSCLAFTRDITPSKNAEKALLESRQQLESFMDSAPDSFYLYDSDLRLVKVNQRVYDRSIMTSDDLGKHMLELSPLLKVDERYSVYQTVLETGEPVTFEAVLQNEKLGQRILYIRAFKVGSGLGLILSDITEHRRTQRALEQSEERYRTLVENSPNAISVVIGTRIVYVNQKRLELTGHRDKSELIGIDSLTQMNREELPNIRERLDARVNGDKLTPVNEFKMRRRDGKEIHVIDYTTPISWEGQDAVLHTLQDVTESRRLENELKQREGQYRKLFEDSNDAIFLHKSTGKIFDVNSLACELLGYTREQLLSINMSDLISLNSEISANEILTTVIDEGAARFTVKFLKSDATEFDVSMSSSVVDRENDIIQEIVRDVTEILKYRDRLKAIHTHATWLSSAINIHDVAKATTHAIEETLGFHRGGVAIVEGDHLRFLHLINVEQDGEDLQLPLDGKGVTVQAVRQGKSFLIRDTRKDEDFWIPEDPQYVPLSALIVPVKLGGSVVAVLNVESLSTDAFTLQDQELLETLALHVSSAIGRLRKLEELEDLVQEKTKELLEAEQMVTTGKIAASVGHDLKSPFQIIKNAVYLLKKTPGDSEEMISMIEDSVNRANQMIEEFRLRTRDSPVMLVKTDLSKLLDRTVKEISLSCNVELVNNTSEICEVVLDPAKIRRVLDNMIKNAVEAMPQGGTLTVETGREGGYIYINVSDTGVGIPEEKLSTLFKPFQTTKSKGLGLGLSYCKRAVEAHGGRIQVESVVGKGTTFTIMIPDNLEEPESVPSINY